MQSKASNPLKSSSICFVNQSSKSLIDLRQSNTAFYTNIRMRKGPFASLVFMKLWVLLQKAVLSLSNDGELPCDYHKNLQWNHTRNNAWNIKNPNFYVFE